MEKKKAFLINVAYWAVIAAAVYLAFEYLVPVSIPVLLGLGVAWMVVSITRKLRCPHKPVRLALALVFYGVLGLLVVLLAARGASLVGVLVKWIPQIYENKFEPLMALAMAIEGCRPIPYRPEGICCFWDWKGKLSMNIRRGRAVYAGQWTILVHFGTRYTKKLRYRLQAAMLGGRKIGT